MKQLDSNFWNKYFKVYDILNMVIPYQELLDDLVKELDVKKGDLILDAGSGTGNLSIKLEKLGAKVIALDNNSEAIKRHKYKNPDAEIISHDLNEPLPFEDNYFDKIVCNNVLYIISKDKRINLLNELFRVLRQNGILVMANPKYGSKPIKICYYHIKRSLEKIGPIKTSYQLIKLFWPTILILYYTSILKKHSKKIDYDLIKINEFFDIFNNLGFQTISNSTLTYANQAVLDVAFKFYRKEREIKINKKLSNR